LGVKERELKLLQIRILQSGYVVGRKHLRTVEALEAELIRRGTKEARVVPETKTPFPFRKVMAALRVLQRHGIFIGMVGNVQSDSQTESE
jgi:hypothetical protein